MMVRIMKVGEFLISKIHQCISYGLNELNGNLFNNQNHCLSDKLRRSSFFIYFEFTIFFGVTGHMQAEGGVLTPQSKVVQ